MQQGYATFADIYGQVQAFVQDQTSTFQVVNKNEINRLYELGAESHDWQALRRIKRSLSITAGARTFFLPADVDTILAVLDTTTLHYWEPGRLDTLMYADQDTWDMSGLTLKYAELSDSPTFVDFPSSSAEAVRVLSSSAADTSQTVRILGENSNSVPISDAITLNGTSNVNGTQTFSSISSIGIDSSHAGILTISGVSSTTIYAYIGATEKTVRYKRMQLSNLPASSLSASVVYKKTVRKLVNDDDVIEIPIANWLIEMGIARARNYRENSADAQTFYQNAISILQTSIQKGSASEDQVQSRPMSAPRMRTQITVERVSN